MSARERRQSQPRSGDPSPQRWLEEGEVLRTARGLDIVSRYTVPATLRMTALDALKTRRALERQAEDYRP